MLVIGLTGKTGAGKTTVASYLKEKGCYIIDGDIIARQITEKGSDVLPVLQKAFGDDILDENGELIRKRLAERAFSSKENTALLNSITHPAITQRFKSELAKAETQGYKTAVIDAAALLESSGKDLCRKIIVVHADKETRLDRILKRDGITTEQAITRINAQKDDDYYLSQAHIIIRTHPPYNLEEEFLKLEELTD